MSEIKHFLLVFDHTADKMVACEEFGTDSDRAMARYAELEAMHRNSAAMDIVLVGSDSIETVQVTHRTYFSGFAKGQDVRGMLSAIV